MTQTGHDIFLSTRRSEGEAPSLHRKSPPSKDKTTFSALLLSRSLTVMTQQGDLSALPSHESGHNKSAHLELTPPHCDPSSSLRVNTDGIMRACPTVCVCVCVCVCVRACVGFVGVGAPVMKHFLKLPASQ